MAHETDFDAQDLALPRAREIDGVAWRYTVEGDGPRGLLVFPGAVGGAEVGRRLRTALDGYRVLTVAYPAIASVEDLTRGVEELLALEGLEKVDVLGGSFGGLMAQCFARLAPERVRSLVLNATGVPEPGRARTNERFLRVARFVPMGVFRGLLRLVIRLVLRRMPRPERRRWTAYYDGEIRALRRQDLVGRYRLAIDVDRNYRFTPEDLGALPVLVVAGSDDKIAQKDQVEELRQLYPAARVHTFEGVGHGLSLLRPEEWGRVIREFLQAD